MKTLILFILLSYSLSAQEYNLKDFRVDQDKIFMLDTNGKVFILNNNIKIIDEVNLDHKIDRIEDYDDRRLLFRTRDSLILSYGIEKGYLDTVSRLRTYSYPDHDISFYNGKTDEGVYTEEDTELYGDNSKAGEKYFYDSVLTMYQYTFNFSHQDLPTEFVPHKMVFFVDYLWHYKHFDLFGLAGFKPKFTFKVNDTTRLIAYNGGEFQSCVLRFHNWELDTIKNIECQGAFHRSDSTCVIYYGLSHMSGHSSTIDVEKYGNVIRKYEEKYLAEWEPKKRKKQQEILNTRSFSTIRAGADIPEEKVMILFEDERIFQCDYNFENWKLIFPTGYYKIGYGYLRIVRAEYLPGKGVIAFEKDMGWMLIKEGNIRIIGNKYN